MLLSSDIDLSFHHLLLESAMSDFGILLLADLAAAQLPRIQSPGSFQTISKDKVQLRNVV